FLTLVPEPPMMQAGPHTSGIAQIAAPFCGANFRSVLRYILAWKAATNIAFPVLALYLIPQMQLSFRTVTTLWVRTQVSNAFVLSVGGRLSDRLSNKAVLRVALPLYFLCMLGLAVVALPAVARFALPLLYALHVAMGAAAGGIGLATGNIGLKLA